MPTDIDSEIAENHQEGRTPVTVGEWRCPSCACMVNTAFCPGCGERPLDPRHLTVRGLIGQFARFLVHLDHRIVNSLRCMITEPGRLTVAFEAGRRQAYLGPFKLFVLANVAFFALQSATDLRVFSTELELQVHGYEGTDVGRALVQQYLDERNVALDAYSPIYNQAVTVHSRSLIGLMVLPYALFLPLIFWKSSKPFAVHVVFSLHFFAFVLLVYSITAAAVAIATLVMKQAHLTQTMDDVLTVIILIALGSFIYVAINRVYGVKGFARAVHTLLLICIYILCFLAYRFVLVPITLYTT